MASTTYHAQLIKYDTSGNQSILNLKNTGDDVSISRNSNGNLPSTVTSAQTLANAFGSLAFKSAVTWNDVSGLASTELTVSSEGKLADARAIKALNDKIATNASNITKLNSNLADKADSSTVNNIERRLSSIETTGTPDISGKADKSTVDAISNNVSRLNDDVSKLSDTVSNITLYASYWYGSSAPYSYQISNNKITSTNILDLIINTDTQDLVDALSSYMITGYSQGSGYVTIYAWGEKPSMDLSATLVVRGGL